MKALIIGIALLVSTVSFLPSSARADPNCDERWTAADADAVLREVAHLPQLVECTWGTRDVDRDGLVTARDALVVLHGLAH